MSTPHDVPDNFDYDVLADVSQHGASVFDFLSQPNMFSHPNATSPLGHHDRTITTTDDHQIPNLSLAPSMPEISAHLMPDSVNVTSQMVPSEATLPREMSLSPSTQLPVTPRRSKKARNSPASDTKISYPQHFGYSLINQAESFCTTDTAPTKPINVGLPITKPERRVRSSRSTGHLPILVDASTTEPGGSVSGGHSPSGVGDELEPGKDVHNSHTRRCRAKVNNKFQELLRILPTPPPKTGVKHKAQILDYTIRVFREIYAKKLYLEAELALSSRAHLNMWVESIVKPATRLADILNPFMSLICTKEKWQFAETWVPVVPTSNSTGRIAADTTSQDMSTTHDALHSYCDNSGTSKAGGSSSGGSVTGATANADSSSLLPLPPIPEAPLRLGTTVIPSTGNFDDPDLQSKLERFRDRSRAYVCKPRVDPPGRIMCTMRPEWLPALNDEEAFQRAALVKEASLSVCFGVPFFVRGHVAAVVVFYDVQQRLYDAKCVDLAGTIAGLLGNAFGARSEENKSN